MSETVSVEIGASRRWAWRWRLVGWLIVAGLFLLCLLLDTELMAWRYRVVHLEPHGWGRQALDGLRDFGQIVPIVVAMIIVWRCDQRGRWIVPAILIAQLATMAVYDGTKAVIARQRPYAMAERVQAMEAPDAGASWLGWQSGDETYDQESFPSGHSASAFALAAVLAWAYPRLRALFWVLAIGCALSRFIDAVHWPTDCVAGAAIGYAVAWLTLRAIERRRRRTVWKQTA
jgi:membrane-associated phospholipid phosphatase